MAVSYGACFLTGAAADRAESGTRDANSDRVAATGSLKNEPPEEPRHRQARSPAFAARCPKWPARWMGTPFTLRPRHARA